MKANQLKGVMFSAFALLFFVGAVHADELCTKVQQCVNGPAGSSVCGYVEYCKEVPAGGH